MEKKWLTREEADQEWDRLTDWDARAHIDRDGSGKKLRQQIIDLAAAFESPDSNYLVPPPIGGTKEEIEEHIAEQAERRREAREIKARALALPI
jgi:hypothetical protein